MNYRNERFKVSKQKPWVLILGFAVAIIVSVFKEQRQANKVAYHIPEVTFTEQVTSEQSDQCAESKAPSLTLTYESLDFMDTEKNKKPLFTQLYDQVSSLRGELVSPPQIVSIEEPSNNWDTAGDCNH